MNNPNTTIDTATDFGNVASVFSDSKSLARGAAERFMSIVFDAVMARGRAFVALSGGSTPRTLFSILGSLEWSSKINWKSVYFFWVDERMVPYSSDDSNYGVVGALFFSQINIPQHNIHPIPVISESDVDIDSVLTTYSNQLGSLLGDEPVFDLILLGIGADGHTASIFPHVEIPEVDTPSGARFAFSVTGGEPSVKRVSLREEVLLMARNLIFIVGGDGKAEIVRNIFDSKKAGSPVFELPAVRVALNAKGQVLWLLDEAAAALSHL